MTSIPILPHSRPSKQPPVWPWRPLLPRHRRDRRPDLHQLAYNPGLLPRFVRESPVASLPSSQLAWSSWTSSLSICPTCVTTWSSILR